MAAAAPDRKAYLLDKYLRPRASKKRSKRHARGTGLKIIDDDIDTSKLQPLDDDDLEALAGDEDAPQIAGIIDERPDEVKKMEQFQTSSKWRVVTQDDGFDSKVQIEEIKKNITKTAEDSNPMFGKMYSDSEDEKKDSDLSPPRKTEKTKPVSSKNKKIHQNSDSDLSPPRHESRKKSSDRSPVRISKKSEHTTSKKDDRKQSPVRKRRSPEIQSRNSSDSDLSPPRKHENKTKERERKPSRWGHFGPEKSNKTHREKSVDSDLSPPRKSRRDDNSGSKSRKEKRHDKSSDSDLSPPRKSKKDANNDHKSIKSNSGHRKFGNTDLTRKLSKKSPNRNNYNSESPPRKVNNRDRSIDSDLSPPRRSRNDSPRHSRPLRSPDRIKSNMIDDRQSSSKYRNERPRDSAKNNERARYNHGRRNSNSPPPSNKKMAKTLEGKLAGLQDAKQMRNENEEFKRREDELYSKMSADASGKHATTVNRRLGKRETSADKEKNREQQERRRELEEKYSKWGKGLKQVEEQQARVADYLVEASKPLARHRDDATLESTLKQQERAGDPMLQYMREKKKDRNDAPERPMYKGDWPPNRFNIRPGYRWDGVDRSNGYEKKLFDSRSKAKAMAEEAYKWSTEDL